MKHILISSLISTLAFISLPTAASAQGVITRNKPKQEQKEKPKPKPAAKPQAQKTRPAAASKPRSHAASTSSAVNLQAELSKLSNNMVYVQGGTFMMGANLDDTEAYDDEKPRHQMNLSGFYICRYEVTQALWKAVMGSNPSFFKGNNLPVETVSWNDCQQFIRKLNSLTGQNYRLPTEAEWEYAARGGNSSRGYKYSGSNYIDNVAWYDSNSGSKTHPVGKKSPNELGLYDMSGNVYEWCSDWKGNYSSGYKSNPEGSYYGPGRVNRGGGWCNVARRCRALYRDYFAPGDSDNDLGLRLARN